MSHEQWRAFMSQGTRTGKLATAGTDGRPHAVPVWLVLDGDDIVFTTTGAGSVKRKALRRDPRACMCVDDETPPFAFAMVEDAASIRTDLDDLLVWATRIGGRYMGADRAEEFGRRNAVAGELLVRLAPTKVVAQAAVAE